MICSDGAGGGIVAWTDPRNGSPEKTYAQRLSDTCASLWAANGVAVSSSGIGELFPAIVSDGASGAIIAWTDFRTGGADVYAQRLSPAGARLWTSSDVLLCNAADFQFFPTVTTDGAGGAIVTWQDQRNGSSNTDVYARHVTAAGVAQWGVASGGLAVSTATANQTFPMIATDAAGGAIMAWMDARETSTDIYAQRVLSGGQLGGGASLGVSNAATRPSRSCPCAIRFAATRCRCVSRSRPAPPARSS
jgi:hypothetical protein